MLLRKNGGVLKEDNDLLNERFLCCVLFSPFCATAGGYDYVMINL